MLGLGNGFVNVVGGRLHLKCDGTRAETGFHLSAKWASPFKLAGASVWIPAAEVCASAVVMLDTPCSEVVWRVLATHFIRQFPLHFPSRVSPCATTFQPESTAKTLYIRNVLALFLHMLHIYSSCETLPLWKYIIILGVYFLKVGVGSSGEDMWRTRLLSSARFYGSTPNLRYG